MASSGYEILLDVFERDISPNTTETILLLIFSKPHNNTNSLESIYFFENFVRVPLDDGRNTFLKKISLVRTNQRLCESQRYQHQKQPPRVFDRKSFFKILQHLQESVENWNTIKVLILFDSAHKVITGFRKKTIKNIILGPFSAILDLQLH